MASARLRCLDGVLRLAVLGGVGFSVHTSPSFSTSSLPRPEEDAADDLLLVVGRFVLRHDVHDAVSVDVESDFDYGSTPTGSRRIPIAGTDPVDGCPSAMALAPGRRVSTEVWLSAQPRGERSLLRVGMMVLRSMSLLNTPPRVDAEAQSGSHRAADILTASPPRTP